MFEILKFDFDLSVFAFKSGILWIVYMFYYFFPSLSFFYSVSLLQCQILEEAQVKERLKLWHTCDQVSSVFIALRWALLFWLFMPQCYFFLFFESRMIFLLFFETLLCESCCSEINCTIHLALFLTPARLWRPWELFSLKICGTFLLFVCLNTQRKTEPLSSNWLELLCVFFLCLHFWLTLFPRTLKTFFFFVFFLHLFLNFFVLSYKTHLKMGLELDLG